MKVRILGSGTSSGVPIPGCLCPVCTSSDSRNKRLRTSILLDIESRDLIASESNAETLQASTEDSPPIARILFDTSPDLRYQSLREGIRNIDAVIYTHIHADHVFGIDDLRSFNFVNQREIPVYASEKSAHELEFRFSYAFYPDPNYLGGAPPRLKLHRFNHFESFDVCGMPILPFPVMHGRMEVSAFRIRNFAYVTDCSLIPEASKEKLQNLDVLILDGLRKRPHKTHFTLEQAVREIEELRPQKAFLTHMSHEVDHEEANTYLKTLTSLPVELAWDGLLIQL